MIWRKRLKIAGKARNLERRHHADENQEEDDGQEQHVDKHAHDPAFAFVGNANSVTDRVGGPHKQSQHFRLGSEKQQGHLAAVSQGCTKPA
jgi:hypothetical protein